MRPRKLCSTTAANTRVRQSPPNLPAIRHGRFLFPYIQCSLRFALHINTSGVFTLVLEGRVKVKVGKDNFAFEAGPFNAIAVSALTTPHFECDFDAVVSSDRVLLLQIPRILYTEAVNASRVTIQDVSRTRVYTDHESHFFCCKSAGRRHSTHSQP